jgi:ABC-2 type transport system ATP-binding protein
VLEVQSLVKRYGEVSALRDLTVAVGPGECLVLIGRNGAGKTTALRCMAGVLRPTSGTVIVDGIDVAADPDRVRARIGLMPEVPGLYERMSARAYLDYFGAIYDLPVADRRRRIERLLELFELSDAGDRWMGTYSKGMRQKVALIRATLHQPRLVLADEPTSALDPDSARRAWAYLAELRGAGSSLVICTHSMDEAEHLAGTVGIMSAGRLLALGSLEELVDRSGLRPRQEVRRWPRLQDIYLAIVGEHFSARDRDEPAATA